jgi:hypothetical protein
MRPDDVRELFSVAHAHPGMPDVIRQGVDVDEEGDAVDFDYPRDGQP